jgi:hypothetical protein
MQDKSQQTQKEAIKKIKLPPATGGTMLQGRRLQVQVPIRLLDFSINLILPAALCPEVVSASNRNEYQESSWDAKGGRRVRLTAICELTV